MTNDLRYAIRTLTRAPGFVLIAIMTLALGIGANTAIFSVVNGVLLRPLPFNQPERIVRIYTSSVTEQKSSHSAADFRDLHNEQQSLEALAGHRSLVFAALPRSGEPVNLDGSFVTIEFFDVLAMPPAAGRFFSRKTDSVKGERLAVLAEGSARQLYGTPEAAVGQRLQLNGEPHTITGVVPVRAEWPENAKVWVMAQDEVPPSPIDPSGNTDREVRYFDAIGRLETGVTFAQAGQDLVRVAAIIQPRRLATSERRDLRMARLQDEIVGDVRFGLLVMQMAVGLVLLIACANVSSLMIARATGCKRELAIRAALGAGRGRMIRQLLTESLLLGTAGGTVGLLTGAWLTTLLVTVLPSSVPRTREISLDFVVAAVTLIAAMGTGMLFGVMPALQASRTDASEALKRGGERGSARPRARAALVVLEVALTLMLLAGAGLLLNSFLRLQRVDSGLQPENVTVVGFMLPQSRYATGPSRTDVYRRLLEGLSARPEIQAVGVGFPGPFGGSNASGSFFIEGRPTTNPADRPFANLGSVSGGYFQAMGIPLIGGRTFAESDTDDAPPVAIANLAFVRKYWPHETALGKHIRFDDNAQAPPITIVGVVGDVRQLGLQRDAPPILYFPYSQFVLPFTNISIRSSAPSNTVAALVKAQFAAVDPELPSGTISPLQGVIDRSVAQPRFRTALLSAFAIVALLLAAVGLYGLISYSVTQRTREIGIRIALGAGPMQVLLPMVREGLVLAIAGTALGLIGAFLSARVLSSFVFGVETTDPLTFGLVAALLLGVAFIATLIPSRRALRVDPITALRAE
jgi:putative ABC transport system permease protein